MDYGDVINGEMTIVCVCCGETLLGNEPAVYTLCPSCFDKIQDRYPNGWTCAVCGTEINDDLPSEHFLHEAAVCRKCVAIAQLITPGFSDDVQGCYLEPEVCREIPMTVDNLEVKIREVLRGKPGWTVRIADDDYSLDDDGKLEKE